MAKVIAPNSQYTGLSASVMFVNGVGETNDAHLLQWFEEKGYTIERSDPTDEEILATLKAVADADSKPEPTTEPDKPAKKGK
ncbi:hypothetical protein J40TS1_00330 [Paenibacillus montaniterrae]|uniref:Uncharacterized protein n=1 Tax=Paenibacillus montaniterrae TaxID=429341 RepID=A0A920CUW1_9BACL|nr:hypothetical protein [Paenibacillus montaniterrae]GIP14391.1 hypothetical protein J40TS1_00330 [Paenibacillus montaniterrae]